MISRTPSKEREERKEQEEKRMVELVGDTDFDGQSDLNNFIKVEAYKERVRNNLGKKTYHVTIQDLEDWSKKRFRDKAGELDIENKELERKQKFRDYIKAASLKK